MDLPEKKARWTRMLAQAEHFAELDNTIDALARARLCAKEIEAELREVVDPEVRTALERERLRADRRVEWYEKLHADWQARVHARHDRYIAQQQTIYEAPLPKKGLD